MVLLLPLHSLGSLYLFIRPDDTFLHVRQTRIPIGSSLTHISRYNSKQKVHWMMSYTFFLQASQHLVLLVWLFGSDLSFTVCFEVVESVFTLSFG